MVKQLANTIPGFPFSKVVVVVVLGLVGCAGVLFAFGGGKLKFSSPSNSSRSAKFGRVFLHTVKLSPVGDLDSGAFDPKEAWVENIYENYESIPLRKQVAGKRLCVRLEYSKSGPYTSSTPLQHLEMAINENRPKPTGGRKNGTGMTFSFPIDSYSKFPKKGKIVFINKEMKIETRFRYIVK